MHIDYAKESYLSSKNQKHSDPISDLQIIKFLAMDQIVELAANVGDDKIKSIAATMKASRGHKKVTDKQRHSIAAFLLEKYSTARAVLAAAFGVSEFEMFGE